jgi:hypothetical protein
MKFIVNTIPSIPDQRDYPFVPKRTSGFAPSLDLLPDVEEVEDQADYGTCVANGSLSQCEMLAKRHGVSTDLSRMFVYANGRAITGLPPEQPGMIPRDAMKALYRYGAPIETAWPYLPEYQHTIAPDGVFQLADATKVRRYEAVVVSWLFGSLEQPEKIMRIKAALDEGLSVGIAMTVTQSIYGLAGPWRTHQYKLLNQSPIAGGHYMVIIGYDDSVGMWLVQNSWGPGWGDGGFCGLPYAIVDEMMFESWVIRDFAGYRIQESEGIKLELINRFRIDARIIPPVSRIGESVNIWIGAKTPDGTVYLREPGLDDVFTPLSGNNYKPCQTLTLEESTPVTVVRWRNLSTLAGTKVYLAYGHTPFDWQMQMIGIVPQFP